MNRALLIVASILLFSGYTFAQTVDVYPGSSPNTAYKSYIEQQQAKQQQALPGLDIKQDYYISKDDYGKVVKFYEKLFGVNVVPLKSGSVPQITPGQKMIATERTVDLTQAAEARKSMGPMGQVDDPELQKVIDNASGSLRMAAFINVENGSTVIVMDRFIDPNKKAIIDSTLIGIILVSGMPSMK